jgi:PKD repeat protein/urease gamma subunit
MKTTAWFCFVFSLFLSGLLQAQPIVNLGTDTTVCGNNLTLDAGNTGAVFLWSTGAITQTITATNSGIYWVDVTDVSGTTRDSIDVLLVSPPTFITSPVDMSICLGIYELNATSSAGLIEWTDSLGNVLGYGDSILYDVQDTSTIYYQAKIAEPVGIAVGMSSATTPTGFTNLDRGIRFNVTEFIVLNSVSINVNNASFTGLIYLVDAAGDTIARQSVAPGQVGISVIPLNFSIPIGAGYVIGMINIAGGNAQFNNPISNWNLYNYPFLELVEGAPFSTVYAYFYDWEVSVFGNCVSGLDSVLLSGLITPIVDLGADTTLCNGSLILDATNVGSGFSYQWSTGATSPTITIGVTNIYTVTVSSGGSCPVEDSISVVAQQSPFITQITPDTGLCVGIHSITASATSGVVQWLDSTGTLLGLGDTLIYDVQDTVRIWCQSAFYESSGIPVGLPSITAPTGFTNLDRGIKFNVTEVIALNSVRINVDNASFTGLIYLIDAAGDTIARQTVAPGQIGVNIIPLNFSILPGTDYVLGMINITGGNAQFNNPISNWNLYSYPFLELVEGVPFSTVYAYFYDWDISVLGDCASDLDSVLINSLTTPIVDLGADTSLCSSTVTLDATNVGSGFSYIWSTGATSPTIIANATAVYTVTVSSGGSCPVEDSISVVVQQQPIITQIAPDASLCIGIHPIVASANSGVIQWMDSTGMVLGLGDTLNYDVQNTVRIWYQSVFYEPSGISVGLPSTIAPTSFTNLDRGIKFNVTEAIVLNSVRINVDNASFTGLIYLINAAGDTIARQSVTPGQVGVSIIPLSFSILPGTDYVLGMINIAGGNAQFNNPISNWNLYSYPFLELVEGIPFSTVYAYFYDWDVSVLGDCASTLDSVLLNSLTTPIVDLGADTSLCSSTLILDATNVGSGFSYIWSTGATSPTVIGNATGIYKVTVSSSGGNCPVEDSISILVRQRPVITQLAPDTTVCVGSHVLMASSNSGVIQWVDSTGTLLGLGDTLRYDVQNTVRIWYQSAFYEPSGVPVGISSTTAPTSFTNLDRGIKFNVTEAIVLNSVSVSVDNASFTGLIYLTNSAGDTIARQAVTTGQIGVNTIPLSFSILPGTDYILGMINIAGGNSQFNNPVSNWNLYSYPFLELIEGVPFSTVYAYLYDWDVSVLGDCASDLDSVLINSLTTPIVDLGADTSLCSSTVTLDATNIGSGFSYIWSTGATSPTIIGNATAIYKVTVSSSGGNCPVEDSINVVIQQRPVITQQAPDIAVCLGNQLIVANASAGIIQWVDSTGTLLGLGDTLSYDIQDTVRLWYQAAYYEPTGSTVGLPSTTVPTSFTNLDRGIKFNVAEAIILNSVNINVDNASFTGLVYLMNAAGDTIAKQLVVTGQIGVNTIPLNFSILPGTDYLLGMLDVAGGNAQFNNPISNWNLYSYPFLELVEGVPFSTVYAYFYDWEVSVLGNCASDFDSVLVNSLITPVVDLATDTIRCNDTLILDVFNAGATYNWGNTGVTTSNIVITQEGVYNVTVTIGTCTDSDSIDVYLTPIPTLSLQSADTSTCAGEIPRRATGADYVKWYTEPVGGNYLGGGSPFMYDAQVSDTIWCAGQNFGNKIYEDGLRDTFVSARAGYYYPIEARGLLFDVQDDILLKEVTMYIEQTSFIGTIELWDRSDIVMYSQPIVLTDTGKNIVPLGFVIPAGVDYKLMLTDYNAIPVLSEVPYLGFPIVGDYVTIKSGIRFPIVYQYFYNWNVQALNCPTERIPSVVDVLPTPNIDFPVDSVICGDTLILDATASGIQSYLWSTGETSPSIILDSTTQVSLLVTIGICSDEDSMNVFIVEPPSLIIPPNDTTVCQGNVTFHASGNAAYYAWYDSETSATPFSLGDSVLINLQDTTTIWVEGIGFIPKTTPIGEQYNPNSSLNVWVAPQNSVYSTRGMAFDVNSPILLNSVAIYVDTITTATLRIYKTGFPYYTQQLNLTNIGENIVQIDTLLEVGSYSIELNNNSAGKILLLSPYTNLGQLNTNGSEITFTGSIPLASQYVYFFNWKISTPSCATDRLPVNIIVPPSPQITLVADTATCTLGSITLDPILNNDPAYTYAWSNTTSIDDTLVVSSSGYYKVTVTNDGVCSSTQDIYVQFLSTPNDPNVNDFDICSPQNVNIAVPITDGIVVWYDSSNLNTINYLTAPYDVYIGDTTDFWIDVAPKATTRIGKQVYSNPNESSAYLNFIIPNRFDIHEYAVLDSVAIYVETVPANVSIVLMDSLGNSMSTVTYTVTRAKEKVFIPLDFLVPPGEDYQLSFTSINSLFLVDRTPIAVPSSSANIATLTGTIFSDYSYFFDWHFSYAYPSCHSNGDSFTVNVAIPVDIPDSLYTCDSVVIDAKHPNIVSYNWSNGLTTGVATFYNEGTYVLTMTDGGTCTVVDSTVVTQPLAVGLPLGNAACDAQLSTNYNLNNASFSWNTGDTTDIITIPTTGIYAVTITTNEGCLLVDTAFISQIVSPPMPNLGNFVSVCYRDTLDAGYGGQGMTYLWNTGATTQEIIVDSSAAYSVTVTHPLGCTGSDLVSITIDTAPRAAFTFTRSGRTVLMDNQSTGTNQATDYFWEMGDGSTYQIPNPFHTYVDSGCYLIRLTVTDACGSDTDTLRVAIDVPDSTCTIDVNRIPSQLEGISLTIVPNPNTGMFQLQLSESLKSQTAVQLYDLNGRVVYEQELPLSSQKNWEIQTENLPTGVYFLRLLNSKQSQTHRVLILRE